MLTVVTFKAGRKEGAKSMDFSAQTKMISGVLLITVPSIQYGGTFLLGLLRAQDQSYIENPVRQALFRAGHAHAGVLVILALVCQVLADGVGSAPAWATWIARLGTPLAAILIPLGFFLSVASPAATKPNGWLVSTWIGVITLGASMLSLGILLILAAVQSKG